MLCYGMDGMLCYGKGWDGRVHVVLLIVLWYFSCEGFFSDKQNSEQFV